MATQDAAAAKARDTALQGALAQIGRVGPRHGSLYKTRRTLHARHRFRQT